MPTTAMKVTVLYVGSSLLAPLKNAERELNREHKLDLCVAAWNFGSPLHDDEWSSVESDLKDAQLVFVIHVMDGENAARLIAALESYKQQHRAVIVINCMPDLMRRTRMGRLDVLKLMGNGNGRTDRALRVKGKGEGVNGESGKGTSLLSTVGSWMGRQVRSRESKSKRRGHTQYLKIVDRLPSLLRFVPSAGGLRDVKHYLNIFCYFLQPTPANIQSMLLYAVKAYLPDDGLKQINVAPPEEIPSIAIYHPDAPRLFESFDEYQSWYTSSPKSKIQSPRCVQGELNPESTVGLLLMRPQVVSKTTKHYDALIRAIEAQGLSVIPALSTLMDNREASEKFFLKSKAEGPNSKFDKVVLAEEQEARAIGQNYDFGESRVSQIVSLTGFSFVGGPAMNDSEAASEFLTGLNRPYRSAVSLDTQTVDAWSNSPTGLNPVQSGMQIAIPEIDGATEPFIYGGIPVHGVEPMPLDERCSRFARRLKRWNRLRTAPRSELKLALVLFCFPPNKGNIGTAADLDVFPGVWDTLQKLAAEGYDVEIPASPDDLRERLIGGNSQRFASTANVAYEMGVGEYRRLCTHVDEIEKEWGRAPGKINATKNELLIQGVQLGNVFIGVQPTFGYEGDPMRLMMARGGAPHHGFVAFYTYLSRVLDIDAVVHVGTHGALEFMPGKQVGLSEQCWPDRLIGELPNIYLYSVNNPSEGSIAKRRSYAELISYLTPPIENAGLYKDLSALKDLVSSYRQSTNEQERAQLFQSIEAYADTLNL